MGEHRRGDTLRRFGEPIYAWLDSWRAASNPPCTLFTDDTSLRLPRLDEPDAPPHTRITITWPDRVNPDGSPLREQTWIAAEAWWADECNPPPFSEVASWSMALAPGLLVNYIGAGLGRSRIWKWLALPLGYLAAGIFQLVLLALLVIGIVPPLRTFVAGIQVMLTGALGDPLVMVASPIRFNAILSRIERNLRWLREDQECERIAVVAHSQGTGIGLRVLQRRSDRVHLFVTFGTAIEKLHIAAELQAIRRRLGLAITVSAVSLVLIVAAWIVAVVVLDQPLLDRRLRRGHAPRRWLDHLVVGAADRESRPARSDGAGAIQGRRGGGDGAAGLARFLDDLGPVPGRGVALALGWADTAGSAPYRPGEH